MNNLEVFVTDPRMWLIPMAIATLWTVVAFSRSAVVSGDAWMWLVRVESFFVAATYGITKGYGWPEAVSESVAGKSLSVTWDGLIVGAILLASIVLFVLAVRKLSEKETWSWIGVAFLGYHVGALAHTVITGGEPFRTIFT